MTDIDKEMRNALRADAERLGQLTGDDHTPEFWFDCPECGGEGSIEVWESVSKWSIDPPSAQVMPCKACNGSGGIICEDEGDK